ncbi:MAG: hypothetical protein E7554_09575 [Ruminococcaceae bacterium]|nr:hypothetical protein [Oscillospiraceae bacterium]
MKKAFTSKLLALTAALVVMTSLTGCFGTAAPQQSTTAPTTTTAPAEPVSGTDAASNSDVVVDDATAANIAMESYLDGFNTGDAAALADATCSSTISAYLKNNGKDKNFLVKSFEKSIANMHSSVDGTFFLDYDYSVTDANADQVNVFRFEIEALNAGDGEKVEALKFYNVTMKLASVASASDVTSSGDLVSGADVTEKESTQVEMRVYKLDGKWYVFAV